MAVSYSDVKTVLTDPRFSMGATLGADVPRVYPVIRTDRSLQTVDAPDHTRLRRLVAKAFTSQRIERLRPMAQDVVDRLLDDMMGRGTTADLVKDFAEPLPITMICELLGVPYADRAQFQGWTDALLAITAYRPEEITRGREELQGYLAGLVRQRRESPTDDLLGELVSARDDNDSLSEDELVMLGVTLLAAGHETTVNHISNFVYTLLTHPEQADLIKADPELIPNAVEELMRFVPISTSDGFARIAVEDVELSGGVVVRAGEAVIRSTVAANRDPAVFERPDELDLTREHNPHYGFGHGPHVCLGAHLARIELQVALESLFQRLPDLRLAVPADQLVFKTGRTVRGLESLPVEWA